MHEDRKTDYEQDKARDLQQLQCHRQRGKAEKSLKLPSNVKKHSSDRRRNIHQDTFENRQKHKPSVAIPRIMITFAYLDSKDLVLF